MIYQKWFAYIEIQRNPLTTSVPHHIETSRLICSANTVVTCTTLTPCNSKSTNYRDISLTGTDYCNSWLFKSIGLKKAFTNFFNISENLQEY